MELTEERKNSLPPQLQQFQRKVGVQLRSEWRNVGKPDKMSEKQAITDHEINQIFS